jgi:hypothetical protein
MSSTEKNKMSYFNQDAATQSLGSGTISVPGAVQNEALASLLSNYHRSVAHSYKPLSKGELAERLPSGRLTVSPKIDGELWYLMVEGDEPLLVSPRGRVIRNIPLLSEYQQSITIEDEDAPSDVFVSFSSKDMEKATRVVEVLREAGIKPWFSDQNMKNSGGMFQGQLQKQIEECSAVLLLLSEGSCNSEWVAKEIANAHEEEKSVSVLWLDEYQLRPGSPLKFHISHHQRTDASGDKFEPGLKEMAQEIKEHLRPKGTVMAGELFVEKGETGRPRVSALNAVLSGGKSADVDSLSFCAFDLVEGGDAEGKMPLPDYADRYAVLQRRLDGGQKCRPVMSQEVNARDDVSELFDKWVEGGTAEGIVVRGEGNNKIFKVKPSHTVDAAVIGYTEKAGEDAGLIRSLLLAVMREDGSFQEICSCGNDLGGDKSRKELFSELQPMIVHSAYRRVNTKKKIMYHFVRPEVVVEIQFVDVQSENFKGKRIQKMVLRHEADGWRTVRPMNGVSIHNPSVVRRRTDKEVNKVDVRATQFGDLCFVPDVEEKVADISRSESTVLKREVYCKTAKDVTTVRKLLIWKTNKETDDPMFPAYVVHWTDYSPSRKDPLKRVVRIAPTEELAQAIGDEMVAKDIKKGWELQ